MNIIILQLSEYLGITLNFLFIAFIVVVLFLALRLIFLWYWKIDTLVKNQEEQITILRQILKEHRTIRPGSEIDLEL
jgi:hypothetical protein